MSIDLVCNGTGNTVERQGDFGFSPTGYVTETRLGAHSLTTSFPGTRPNLARRVV